MGLLIFIAWVFAHTKDAIPVKLQNFIKKFEQQKQHLQGGAVAILHKDKVIYKTTFGYQKGNSGPITSKTLFPLASVSKPVSALAIALMVDQEKLDFNVQFKMPYLKNAVSLKDILSHTTGYHFSGNREIEQGIGREKLLAMIQEKQPNCPVGKSYFYSNAIFSLVEEILNIKKTSLTAVVKNLNRVLKRNDFQFVPINSNQDIAYPHVKCKDTLKSLPFPPYYPKTAPASAGIFASLDGMIEFYKLSFGYRPDLISQETLDYIHTPIISNRDIEKWPVTWPCDRDAIDSYYGLGWRILKAKPFSGKDFIFHSGYIAGIVTCIGFVPSEEMGIILLFNQQGPMALKNGINFWGAFLS